MKTIYTIYYQNGDSVDREIDWPAEPDYNQIKEVVAPIIGQGCDFEHVTVLFNGERSDMFVDEMGLHKQELKRNELATGIYRAATLKARPGTPPENISYIVGTAIVFHRRIWF